MIAVASSTSRTLPRRQYLAGAPVRQNPNVSAAPSSPPATSVVLDHPDLPQQVRNSESYTLVPLTAGEEPPFAGDHRVQCRRRRCRSRRRGRRVTRPPQPVCVRVSHVGAASAPRARVRHLSPTRSDQLGGLGPPWAVSLTCGSHTSGFFLFIFSEIPRAGVMLMSCLRNIPIFLLRNNSEIQ